MMSKTKFFIILNPAAGHGKAINDEPKIRQFLKASGQDFEIILTTGPGDAQGIVQKLRLNKDTVVVAAGGDGTNNEVVNGLMTLDKALPEAPLFGLLPIGRGNDFAYTARVETDLDKALGTLIAGRTAPLDVGLVKGGFFPEGRYFVNGVGIGFDTKVGFEANKMKHVKSGIAYALGAIKMVAKFEMSPLIRISAADSVREERCALVSVMNGRRMGGTFFMCPHAQLSDGMFGVCYIRHPDTRRRLLRLVLSYTKGQQENYQETHMSQAPELHLQALDGGLAAHADGETLCYEGKELSFTCIPKALQLVCNPDIRIRGDDA
jgi:YegS/Rv2252/BmrU family lipid kinase